MRPITLSEEMKIKILSEFRSKLDKEKLLDGDVTFSKKFKYSDETERVQLLFSEIAYQKMIWLLRNFNSEVAWHGTAKRKNDTYMVTDIFVYPQTVSGSTVNVDDAEYPEWLMSQEDDVFNNLRFHGHSHVNMGTSPSTTDNKYQREVLEQLSEDDFYIFIILNKQLDFTVRIFDIAENTMYENDDIDVKIEGVFDMSEFADEANKMVKERSFSTKTSGKTKYQKNAKKCNEKDFDDWDEDDYYSYHHQYYGYSY